MVQAAVDVKISVLDVNSYLLEKLNLLGLRGQVSVLIVITYMLKFRCDK